MRSICHDALVVMEYVLTQTLTKHNVVASVNPLACYTMPWAIMALATFMKPATLAPFT